MGVMVEILMDHVRVPVSQAPGGLKGQRGHLEEGN